MRVEKGRKGEGKRGEDRRGEGRKKKEEGRRGMVKGRSGDGRRKKGRQGKGRDGGSRYLFTQPPQYYTFYVSIVQCQNKEANSALIFRTYSDLSR